MMMENVIALIAATLVLVSIPGPNAARPLLQKSAGLRNKV